MSTILVTGGAGFIGSCFVRRALSDGKTVINYDKLTYAGHLESLPTENERHVFIEADICDTQVFSAALQEHRPEHVVHFAAESHVDRSIDGPSSFVNTNVNGTCSVLEACLNYYRDLADSDHDAFRLLHVSTDEVYGSLGPTGYFTETTPYSPNSPYSASKASSDMFVRAYHETYGLPILISNCSNNYGPYQFPEKLIPLVTLNALEGRPLPVYGDGKNIRDWLFVEDHCQALETILSDGKVGETYNIGGDTEKTNIEIVQSICELVDELTDRPTGKTSEQIEFVADRPGHDRRYAIDASKIRDALSWEPKTSFTDGLRTTVKWYVENRKWIDTVTDSGARKRQGLG